MLAAITGAGFWLYREAAASRTARRAAHRSSCRAQSSIAAIAELLAKEGVIRNPTAFEALVRLSGRGAKLKAGEYEFPAASARPTRWRSWPAARPSSTG